MAKKKSTVKKVTKMAKKNPKAFVVLVLVVFLLVGLGIGGYFVYTNFINPAREFSLVGGNVESIGLNTEYVEKGVKATYKGQDVSNEVKISYFEGTGSSKTAVDKITTDVEKSFTVDYSISHEKLQESLSRTVNVVNVAPMSINFLELGNHNTGDCTYIKAGDTDILIDAGSKTSSTETVVNYLKDHVEDNKIEYLVVTHAHQDHIASLVGTNTVPGVLETFNIDNIIQFARTDVTSALYGNYCTKRDAKVSAGTHLYYANDVANNVYNIAPGITMKVLDQRYYYEKASTENDYSVCTLFTQGSNNYLFTGDLEKKGEESLVDKNTLPHVQLFKGGHHGSATSNNDCLLSVIQPEVVCICCCAGNNEYSPTDANQFPYQETINRLAIYTKRIYVTTVSTNGTDGFTSMNGIITFSCVGGSEYEVHGSNNDTILKDTDWFKAHRTWPSGGIA